jgi:DNA-binding transcriptional LysR family regulator
MRIRNLSSFVKVARLGSFRAASTQLHVSQPAVSSRINALEDELGVKLFRRGKSGTHLTEKGSKLLPYAENLLAIAQKMKSEAGQLQQHKGNLKIGIADTLAHLWLSPLLQQWQYQHPQISFELTSDVTPVLTKQLQHHQIDLSLMVLEQPTNASLISQVLCRYPQVWVKKRERSKEQRVWSISDLGQKPILSFPRDTSPWHYLQQLFKNDQQDVVIHTCSSVASLISLVEQGLGVALLPLPLVEKQIGAGTLQQIQCEIEPLTLDFCSSWRGDEERMLPKLLADSAREIMQTAT